eukprot:GILI01008906.1.p1 GENE.GILI01008906.1~~GILI01008906.1.p1  ORF type:complete len:482 (-),score=132.71 GILI01008906.1:278-1624(-)
MRYLVNDKYFKGTGPIFFYTGNEGDIVWFYKNTGFVAETLAKEFKALVIFAEHRYFGTTQPFGRSSLKPSYVGWLSSEQALMDYVELLWHVRKQFNCPKEKCPVIAVGGSYGGMLAAWMRMKYPHEVAGALAASAPILQFTGITGEYEFMKQVTKDFTDAHPHCDQNIHAALSFVQRIAQRGNPKELQLLRSSFRICDAIPDGAEAYRVLDWLQESLVSMAMCNYPYATDFLAPLPAYPIRAACKQGFPSGEPLYDSQKLLKGLSDVLNVYMNYTGSCGCECFKLPWNDPDQQEKARLDDAGWNYLACTEMMMPIATNGVTDMFPAAPWDPQAFSQSCKEQFGVVPQPFWAEQHYGGRTILPTVSNIIFSNGNLDPWSSGGVHTTYSDSVVSIEIKDGAHHLDLRLPGPEDPQSLVEAREQEVKLLRQFIGEALEGKKGSASVSIQDM